MLRWVYSRQTSLPLLLCGGFALGVQPTTAKKTRFEEDIRPFEVQDQACPPQKGGIHFLRRQARR